MSYKIIERNDKNGKSKFYIYAADYTKLSAPNQLELIGSRLRINLNRAITPRYFKLIFFSTPNTYYEFSNWRKVVRNDPINPNIITNAPTKFVWRESNDGGATSVTYEFDVPVGNYDIISLKPVLESLMNATSPNNTYEFIFNEVTGRTEINRLTGTHTFALWYGTYDQNRIQFEALNELVSVQLGWGLIPLEDTFTTQKKSTYVYDFSPSTLLLVEIVGYELIENTAINDEKYSNFTATWVIPASTSNSNFIDGFTENKDFTAKTYINDRKTFSYIDVNIKDYFYSNSILLNGSAFLMIFEFEEYD
jgi:hypothetical protein